jgi:tRNA modification GTPase
MSTLSDTIVACATPPGEGAVAVVRLSGPAARTVAQKLTGGQRPRQSHRLGRVGLHRPDGTLLDEAMLVEMHAPRSYTGEDVVELQVHGSTAVVRELLALCHHWGARPAEAGEFTLRAFLNGRMDLAQAEAVADLIGASSEAQRRVAAAQLEGGLSRVVSGLVGQLETILTEWRAALDFPEHPSGDGRRVEHTGAIEEVHCRVQALIGGSRVELSRGRQIVLAGAPNVGKSSLLNAWLGRERVLVDDAPGTTRDPVEVEMTDGLLRWSVWDTAGIRSGASPLEERGIGLSLERLRSADVALWLVSPDAPVWPEVGSTVVVVGSKADLASVARRSDLETEAARRGVAFWGWVSARTGEGLVELRQRLGRGLETSLSADVAVVVRERHVAALQRAGAALAQLRQAEDDGMTLDVLAMELEGATKALGAILGRDVDAEVLDRIFAQFCIGK